MELPDDILLEVFRLLEPGQLLLARGVCRRWRDLALDPSIWCHKRLLPWHGKRLVLAVLQLAPCLREIRLDRMLEHDPQSDEEWTDWEGTDSEGTGTEIAVTDRQSLLLDESLLVAAKACAVESIILTVDSDSSIEGAAAFLRRQGELARTRELRVIFAVDDAFEDSVMKLLRAVLCIPSLKVLWISNSNGVLKLPAPASLAARPPCLKELGYDCWSVDALLVLLLEAHAATLEKVKLHGPAILQLPVELLARIPGLRVLHCTELEDMAQLLECAQLQEVSLDMSCDDSAASRQIVTSASCFLQAADKLRCLSLDLACDGTSPVEVLAQLVPEGSAAHLQSLRVSLERSPPNRCRELEPLEPLFRKPLVMPELRKLELYGLASFPSRYLSDTLPNLRLLSVTALGCPYAWLHSALVSELLRRLPRLHMRLPYTRCSRARGCRTRACRQLQCHHRYLGVFSHPSDPRCEWHSKDTHWLRWGGEGCGTVRNAQE